MRIFYYLHLIISLIICFAYSAIGQTDFCDIQQPQANQDNGSFCIDLSGDAGPFIYTIYQNDELFREQLVPVSIEITESQLPAGIYRIIITDDVGCSKELMVELMEIDCDYQAVVTAIGHVTSCNNNVECGAVGCTDNGYIELSFMSDLDNPATAWSGPGGFSSTDLNIYDLAPGTYVFTVTGIDDICPSREPIQVSVGVCEEMFSVVDAEGDQDCITAEQTFASNVEIVYEDISYISPEGLGGISAQLVNNNELVSLYWAGPNGDIMDQDQIRRISEPGTYCPIITGTCENVALACVEIKLCTDLVYTYETVQLTSCEDNGSGFFEVTNLSGEDGEDAQIEWQNLSTGETGVGNIDPLQDGNYQVFVRNDKNCLRVIETFTVPIPEQHNFSYTIKFDEKPSATEPGIVSVNVIGNDADAPYKVRLLNPNAEEESMEQVVSDGIGSVSFSDVSPIGNSIRFQIIDANGHGIDCAKEFTDCREAFGISMFNFSGADQFIDCNSSGGLDITFDVSGGAPWYYVSAGMLSTLDGDDDWTYFNEDPITEINPTITIPNVPAGEIRIDVTDDCGRSNSRIIKTCDHLECSYEQVSDDKFSVFEKAFSIEQDCACLSDECGGIFSFDSNNRDLRIVDISNERLIRAFAWHGINEYRIIWPDISDEDLRIDTLTVDENGVVLSNENDFDISDGLASGIYNVIIERSDGCVIEIPFEFVDNVEFSVPNSISIDEETEEAYISISICEECATNTELEENFEALCGSDASAIKSWTYIPNDLDNPCFGGGRILVGDFSNQALVNLDYTLVLSGNEALRHIDNERLGIVTYPNNTIPTLQSQSCVNIFGGYSCIFESPESLADYFNTDIPIVVNGFTSYSLPICDDGPTTTDPPDDILPEGDPEAPTGPTAFECNFNINQDGFGEGFNQTYDAPVVGTILNINYSFLSLEDHLIVSGGGLYYDSDCVSGTGNVQREVTDNSPITVFVSTNCEGRGRTSRYSVNISCIPPPGIIATESRTEIPDPTNSDLVSTTVYPNPFINSVTLEVDNFTDDKLSITVTDMSGVIVQKKDVTSKESTMNLLNNQPAGVYQLHITDSKSYDSVQKLIKLDR